MAKSPLFFRKLLYIYLKFFILIDNKSGLLATTALKPLQMLHSSWPKTFLKVGFFSQKWAFCPFLFLVFNKFSQKVAQWSKISGQKPTFENESGQRFRKIIRTKICKYDPNIDKKEKPLLGA